jgi:hypothetical protein
MSNTKLLAIKKENALVLAQFVALFSIAVTAPFVRVQPITGSIVNATLFLAVMLLGFRKAVLISTVPSLISLTSGLMPLTFAPLIPYIMVGNIILILTFDYLRHNYWIGATAACLLKFIFLLGISNIYIHSLVDAKLVSKAETMFGGIQLATAVVGAVIAYYFFKLLKRNAVYTSGSN